MRTSLLELLVWSVLSTGVAAHGHHSHDHGEKQVPLHEQEFVQDSLEELERKWAFEVCYSTQIRDSQILALLAM